jgi:hypothetical protein
VVVAPLFGGAAAFMTMIKVRVENTLPGLTEVLLARPFVGLPRELVEWRAFQRQFLVEYYENRAINLITSDQDWSLGRDLPNSELIAYGKRPFWPTRVYFTPNERMTPELASDIVDNGDHDMGLIWITTQDPRTFFDSCAGQQFVSDMEWAEHFIKYYKAVDIVVFELDGNGIMVINAFKEVYSQVLKAIEHLRSSVVFLDSS